MRDNQKTLRGEYKFVGKGLHSGLGVTMVLKPAPVNTGIRFHRVDLGKDAYIEALVDYVTYTQRSTMLENNNIKIQTLEHLMATFYALGVDNAIVEIDNFEVPILDGSALPYVRAICADGLLEQDAPRKYYNLDETISYTDEKTGSSITLTPADTFSAEVTIDFNSKVLGVQTASYTCQTDFAHEIAPCRTFVFFHELEFLFKNNLIKGGDLENAIVIVENEVSDAELSRMASLFNVEKIERRPEGYLDNVKLHFDNECARHKLLDVLGDFSLMGIRLNAKVVAVKSGHKINTQVAKLVRQKMIFNH
ncbi:MAG: UDP-3-O-acyl-N-acetylglucosamine deacetylase [Bacteroidales bacterium]|nr:UDP-3-O-acyl-N-acetylglucosamine deacetylase [Bacteroidales bacterium]